MLAARRFAAHLRGIALTGGAGAHALSSRLYHGSIAASGLFPGAFRTAFSNCLPRLTVNLQEIVWVNIGQPEGYYELDAEHGEPKTSWIDDLASQFPEQVELRRPAVRDHARFALYRILP